jgi:hypothetical protein
MPSVLNGRCPLFAVPSSNRHHVLLGKFPHHRRSVLSIRFRVGLSLFVRLRLCFLRLLLLRGFLVLRLSVCLFSASPLWANPSFERTAEKLRFSVPSALRAPAAAQLKLQGLPQKASADLVF